MIKNPSLFAGSLVGLTAGVLLLLTGRKFENTALDTFINPELLDAMLLFLGFFITGIALFCFILSFILSKTTNQAS